MQAIRPNPHLKPRITRSQRQPRIYNRRREVNRVLWITLMLNLLVALGKIVLGLTIGALSVTADGFHSLADGTSNVVALIGNTIAGTPPDDDHPYGHQRFETLAALGIGSLLALTAFETMRGIIDRLMGGQSPEVSLPAFLVLLMTLIINIGVNRYQVREGKRLNSEVLLADAANTGADIFVTLSVLVSMVLVYLFQWNWVDIAAALLIVGLIGRAALQILKRTGSVLVDTAPFTPEALTQVIAALPHILKIERVRSRGSSDAAYIDLIVQIPADMTVEQSACVACDIRNHLQAQWTGVVEVNIEFAPGKAA